jgi:hypothetical protein
MPSSVDARHPRISSTNPGSINRSGVTVFETVNKFLRILAYLDLMVESRRASRLHVLKTATIKFVGGSTIDCLVLNLSSTGASLEVSSQAGIPERFILVMPGDGLHLSCRTVWRSELRIGVTFV